MKLSKHIGYTLLTSKEFRADILLKAAPNELQRILSIRAKGEPEPEASIVYALVFMLDDKGSKNYYITESVLEKLDLLKVERKKNIDGVMCYDYTVFKKYMKNCRLTFFLPNNECFRLVVDEDVAGFVFLGVLEKRSLSGVKSLVSDCGVVVYHANTKTGFIAPVHEHAGLPKLEDFIYKILCFFFLSENEEIVVPPRQSVGTKKKGKVLNEMDVPITIVSSKWNVTSVRTEGFLVSPHFRLQKCGPGWSETRMVFIDQFEKHGYIRHAAKEHHT